MVQIAGDGLDGAEHHPPLAVFLTEPGRKQIGLQPFGHPQSLIFGVILCHQLLDVGEDQNAPLGLACQLSNHQTLAGPGGQHQNGRFTASSKMTDHGIDGFTLIGAESERRWHCGDSG